MRLFIALALTTTLALGCSSGNGSGSSPGNGGSGGTATGGSAAGGSAGSATGGSGGSAAGGSAAGGSAGTAAGGAATDGGTADTYASFAKGFFDTYCVSCHGPTTTDQARDYSTMTDITRDHALIRCGVATTQLSGCGSIPAPKQFPIGNGPKPTDAERTRLVAWIDAGLPQ